MAGADYKTCDGCGGKSYYDANLDWEFDDEERPNGIWNLGDIAALCMECAKTFKCVVLPMTYEEARAREKEWKKHAERCRSRKERKNK